MAAEERALEAELSADETCEPALLVREANSDESELASEPVAVDRAEFIDEARLASSEVMVSTPEDASLMMEDMALDKADVTDASLLVRLLSRLSVTAVRSGEGVSWACFIYTLKNDD